MDNRLAKYLLGPWLIGTCTELVIQGVLSAQFVKYFGTFRADPMALKAAVVFLALITCITSIQAFASVWGKLILHFGNVGAATRVEPFSGTRGIFGATITLLVQSYYCSRLYVISKKWYIVVPPGVLAIFTYVTILIAHYYIFQVPQNFAKIGTWFNIYLPAAFVADVVITASIAYFFIKSKRDMTPQSVGLVNALVRLTFQTAAPATTCALVNFIISLTFPQYYPGSRDTAGSAVNTALPKLYAFSMMWTLNQRSSIRATHLSCEVHGSASEVHLPSRELDRTGVDEEPRFRSMVQTNMSQIGTARDSTEGRTTDAYSEMHGTPTRNLVRLSMAGSEALSQSEEEMEFAPPEVDTK
ncbi:hypothetical protein DFH09DRAFT_1276194 [Mycena vulgaris]|nr:hypothetical protein DFH09DRAFT_1276194 [Mycena vulgaris]